MVEIVRNDMLSRLGEALAYPFKGEGKILLLMGTLFFGMLDWLSGMWIIGILFSVFSLGYISAYLFKVVVTSASGGRELPDWPSFNHFGSDILTPLFQILGTVLISFGPLLVYAHWVATNESTTGPSDPIFLLLLIGGILYWPMAMVSMALFKSFGALNPLLIVSSILRVPGAYLGACTIFGLVLLGYFGIQFILPESLPLIGPLLTGFFGLYFMFVEMRVLGLLYHDNRERLAWFDSR